MKNNVSYKTLLISLHLLLGIAVPLFTHSQINITPTSATACNKSDGKATINISTAATGFDFEYSIDGVAYQSTSNAFTNLAVGNHTASVRDKTTQCVFSRDFAISCPCTSLNVTVSTTNATSFTVNVTGGMAPYQYSLDNNIFQSSNVFSGLTTGTTYTLYVKDVNNCKGQTTFFLSNPLQCNTQSGSGGQGTTFITQNLGTNSGNVAVNYDMYSIPDQMDIYYNDVLVATTGGLVSGAGTLNFNYTPIGGGPYSCVIRMYAPNSGTAWQFTAHCPVVPAPIPVFSTPTVKGTKSNQGKISLANVHLYDKLKGAISPNPSTDIANLQINGVKGEASITLSDLTGKILWKASRLNDGNVSVPVAHLQSGTYIITVINNGQRKTLKLIKVK